MMGDFGMPRGGGGNMMRGGFPRGGGGGDRMPYQGGFRPPGGRGRGDFHRGRGDFHRGRGDFHRGGEDFHRGRGGGRGGRGGQHQHFEDRGPSGPAKKETPVTPKVEPSAPDQTKTPSAGPSSVVAAAAASLAAKPTADGSLSISKGPGDKPVPAGPRKPAAPGENEPEYDESLCILDWYSSDLNLKIKPTDFCSAEAMSNDGFGYMWAGVRASYGVTRGRVCFEVRIDGNKPTDHLEQEANPNVLRVGWSLPGSNLQLGEIKHSYGYGGTAKISENCKFKDYGVMFGVGSVVGTYLDMSSENCFIRYTVDGKDQGVAFRFQKRELQGKGLFPHVLTKNQDFTVNFGQLSAPMRTLLPGFTPIGQLDLKDGLVRGPVPPPSKSDCQVLMMVGLPGAGKTFWAEKFAKDNEDKNWNILGTNNLIEKMKVQGLSRKRNYHGRWELLIKKCMDCFNILLGVAAKRRRNYILDQTNVYPTARAKKMRDFSGFDCQAVVAVPTDDEFRRRVAEREAIEGKEVPDSAVLNMKCNFVLPEIEETNNFSEVWYTELGPQDSKLVVAKYNQEAMATGMRVQGGVQAFKSRNEMKRKRENLQLPGRHVNPEKAAKLTSTPATPAPTPTPGTPAPSKPITSNANKSTAPDIKPDVKPVVNNDAKNETNAAPTSNQQQSSLGASDSKRDSGRRSDSRSKAAEGPSRRRSRSRDRSRRKSQSRERSRNNRRDRRRSRDRSREKERDRDRPRKRSRSRSRDRDSGNQRVKREINPWDRGGNTGGQNSMDNNFGVKNEFGDNRDFQNNSRTGGWNQGPPRGGPSGRGRGAWDGGRDIDNGRRDRFDVKNEYDVKEEQDRGYGDGFRGRGGRGGFGEERGRGGRGGNRFEAERGGRFRENRGSKFDNDRDGNFDRFDGQTENFNNDRDNRRFQDEERFHPGTEERTGFDRVRGGARGGSRGGRGGFDERQDSDRYRGGNQQKNNFEGPERSGSNRNVGGVGLLGIHPGHPVQERMVDSYDRQEGNNEYFNNAHNFGGAPSHPHEVDRDRTSGRMENVGPGRPSHDRLPPRDFNRDSHGAADNSKWVKNEPVPSTSQDRRSGSMQQDVKVRDLDEEFASRMERKLQDCGYEDQDQEQGYQDENYHGGDGYQNDYYEGEDQQYHDDGYNYNSNQDYGNNEEYYEENNDYGNYSQDQRGQNRQDNDYQPRGQRQDEYSNDRQPDHYQGREDANQDRGRFGNRGNSNYNDKKMDFPPRHGSGRNDQYGHEQSGGPPQHDRQGPHGGPHGRSSAFEPDSRPYTHGQQRPNAGPPDRQPPYGQQAPRSNNQKQSLPSLMGQPVRQNQQFPPNHNNLPHPSQQDHGGAGAQQSAAAAALPGWNKPGAEPQNNTALRKEGYPISSDGRALNMGYSVQYHGEDSYSARDDYYQESVRVHQGKGGAAASHETSSFTSTSRTNFPAQDLNRPNNERLNDSSAITGVNPPPPDAGGKPGANAGGQAVPGGASTGGAQGNSGPDYAALLQYLQFYQKQMNTDPKK